MSKKNVLALVLTPFIFVACGGGPDIPDMPDMNDFEADLNKKLTDAGLDPVDVDQMTEDALEDMNDEDTGKPVKISSEKKSVEARKITAGKLWPEVKAFAEENYPGAILVAYNNYGPKTSNPYLIGSPAVKTGESEYWIYIFALNQAAIDDGALKEKSEAFGVKYESGKLAFVPVTFYPEDIDGDQAFGDEWFGVDSDVLFANAFAAVQEEYQDDRIQHITYDCLPTFPTTFANCNGECEVMFYNARNTGYAVSIYASNGEVQNVAPVTFEELF